MIRNEREIIELEITTLKKTVAKLNVDYVTVSKMIDNLMDDRIGMTKELVVLMQVLGNKTVELEAINNHD